MPAATTDQIVSGTRNALAALLACAFVMVAAPGLSAPARAADEVELTVTIKDHKFEPAELHAAPGKAIAIHVTNLNTIVSEFENFSATANFSQILSINRCFPIGSETYGK